MSDNPPLARHLRDDIFSYSAFAGVPGQSPPALVAEATFESRSDFPRRIRETMRARDGTELRLTFWDLGLPQAYVRRVDERVTEVGAFAVPARFALEIDGVTPVGEAQIGPLADAPPAGADLQNLWYQS